VGALRRGEAEAVSYTTRWDAATAHRFPARRRHARCRRPQTRWGLGEQGLERCPPSSEDGRGGSASGAFGLATMPLDKALDGLVAEPALGIHA